MPLNDDQRKLVLRSISRHYDKAATTDWTAEAAAIRILKGLEGDGFKVECRKTAKHECNSPQ